MFIIESSDNIVGIPNILKMKYNIYTAEPRLSGLIGTASSSDIGNLKKMYVCIKMCTREKTQPILTSKALGRHLDKLIALTMVLCFNFAQDKPDNLISIF